MPVCPAATTGRRRMEKVEGQQTGTHNCRADGLKQKVIGGQLVGKLTWM
jgi:hypothetical protein